MNERIEKLVKESGGEFWQRIESDGVLNKEAYITFDPPQSLEKFAELIVRECVQVCSDRGAHHDGLYSAWADDCSNRIEKHFGVEE